MVKRYYEVEVNCDFGLIEVEVEFSSDDPMPTENEIHDAACEVIESALSDSNLKSYRQVVKAFCSSETSDLE